LGPRVNSRQQTLTAILDWFAGVTNTPGDELAHAVPDMCSFFRITPTHSIRQQLSAISCQLSANVRLVVHDILGREVAVLANERNTPGIHQVKFDAAGLASGVYFYRLEVTPVNGTDGYTSTRRMLLLR